jgi:alkaline phosphatase
MATGVVVTSTITHATPASFTAHVKSRKMEDKIAEQLLANRVNVILGGGRKFFLPKSDRDSARKDDVNLMASAREAGYLCIETADALRSAHGPHILGLFQLDALKTTGPEPSLAVLTQKAIQVLKRVNRESIEKKSGFFLMVEGSQIDWACHANDAKAAVRQVLLFDQAVEAAVDFALRDGHTLVIVTADHETGGLTLAGGGNEDKGDAEFTVRWSTKGHTGTPVPIYALGPSASQFAGVCDNTDIPKRIARLLGLRPFPRPVK